jgi:hypothetical protein
MVLRLQQILVPMVVMVVRLSLELFPLTVAKEEEAAVPIMEALAEILAKTTLATFVPAVAKPMEMVVPEPTHLMLWVDEMQQLLVALVTKVRHTFQTFLDN